MRRLAMFIGIFFVAYMVLIVLVKNTPISASLMKSFRQLHNNCCQNLFNDTKLYFQILDNKSVNCEIQGIRFQLPAAKATVEFDSKFYFVNEKKIRQDLEAIVPGTQAPVDITMQNFDYTFWRGMLLCLVIWIALVMAGWSIGIHGVKPLILSFVFLLSFCTINYFFSISYFRIQADKMSPWITNNWIKDFIQFFYQLNTIEFQFFGVISCYFLAHYKKI